jgi:hypothetical protein
MARAAKPLSAEEKKAAKKEAAAAEKQRKATLKAKAKGKSAREKKQEDQARLDTEEESESERDEESQASPKPAPKEASPKPAPKEVSDDDDFPDYNEHLPTKGIQTLVLKSQFTWVGGEGVRFIIAYNNAMETGFFDFPMFFVKHGLCALKGIPYNKEAATQWLDHSKGVKPRENRDKVNKCIHDGICLTSSLMNKFFTEQDLLRANPDHIIEFPALHTTDQVFLKRILEKSLQRKTLADPSKLFYNVQGGELSTIDVVQSRAVDAHSAFARIHELINHLLGLKPLFKIGNDEDLLGFLTMAMYCCCAPRLPFMLPFMLLTLTLLCYLLCCLLCYCCCAPRNAIELMTKFASNELDWTDICSDMNVGLLRYMAAYFLGCKPLSAKWWDCGEVYEGIYKCIAQTKMDFDLGADITKEVEGKLRKHLSCLNATHVKKNGKKRKLAMEETVEDEAKEEELS